MKRHIVALYLWMLLVAPVLGQVVRVTSTSEGREFCRIVNGQQQCGTVRTVEYGTGVIVGRDLTHDYILTAKHVLDFAENAVHGRRAEVVAKHPTEDLAILRTPATTCDVATMGDDPSNGLAVYLDGLGDSGKADAKDYRQARGQVIGSTTVSHPSRDGDSGGAIAVGSQLYGIITHTDATRTRFVPASICRPFCVKWGVPCCPPPGSRVAPLPPPPPRDIPDRQKVARIEALERQLASLRADITSLKKSESSRDAEIDKLLEAVTQLATVAKQPGPPGRDGKDGRTDPIEVRIVSVDDRGKRTTVRHMKFQPGEPIDLVFHEKFLREEK